MRLQEIDEAYLHGFTTFLKKQLDLYKNPSRKEWQSIKQGVGNVRAFLVDQDVIVWNTYEGVHQMVRDELKLPKTAIPIVIYGRPGQSASIDVTDNSRNSPLHHDKTLAETIKAHPYLNRMFTNIDVHYYDEDIYGRWEELEDD